MKFVRVNHDLNTKRSRRDFFASARVVLFPLTVKQEKMDKNFETGYHESLVYKFQQNSNTANTARSVYLKHYNGKCLHEEVDKSLDLPQVYFVKKRNGLSSLTFRKTCYR